MKALFEELLPSALQCGVGLFEFWELTLAELILIIEAYNRNLEIQQRRDAANIYTQADLIAASVARIMSSDAKYPAIHEVFPDLFEAPTIQKQQNWLLAKERMLDFAEGRNSRTRKE